MYADTFDELSVIVTNECMEYLGRTDMMPPTVRATALMRMEKFPMHAPIHHFLVPALLISECRKRQGYDKEVLQRDLSEAVKRSRNILGGFCGFYGACGAAVGLGIFWSIITDCTPMSSEPWTYANRATGQALIALAAMGGPRCCKRVVYSVLSGAVNDIREILKLDLTEEKTECSFFENNKECLKGRCMFYPKSLQ